MRVLLTVDAVGGVWQYGLDLARGLSRRGARPVLALLGPAADAVQRAEAQAISGATLIETGLPLDWLSDKPAPVLAAGAALAGLAREIGADLVQLNSPALGAAMTVDVPLVAVTHGCLATWWEAARPGEPLCQDFRWHHALMQDGLRAAHRVVAPTASYAAAVARQYQLRDLPTVVHNGRTRFAVDAAPQAIADRALTVGRLWDPAKRAHLLDSAAARLSVPFDAAGHVTGPHGEHIVLAHLNLLGQLGTAALGQRLARRPVFVSAACFEPFGLAALEAANEGCALVLADIASFHELWDGAALFVPGDDAAAYAQTIEALLADRDLRLRLGEAARERARRYTPEAMADGMLAIYADLLGEGMRAAV